MDELTLKDAKRLFALHGPNLISTLALACGEFEQDCIEAKAPSSAEYWATLKEAILMLPVEYKCSPCP